MRKSCHVPSFSPPQISPNTARYSTDMADQYSQIAQFLTTIIQDVNNSEPKQASPLKPHINNFISVDENLQSSRRKSSVIKNLRAPLLNKNKSHFNQSKNSSKNNSKTNIRPEQTNSKNNIKTDLEPPHQSKKIVYKRFMSSMDLETNSQELFANNPADKTKKEISTKTLKILKCLNRPEKCIKYCCYALLSLMAGKTGAIPEDFLLTKEKEFEWMKVRELLKGLSDDISKNKNFFKDFFDMSLDEDNLMKSKYYIGKAMKKINNYKSPYREYFNEIAGFTQSSIDYFTNKRKNSRALPKTLKKRENYEDTIKNTKILEEPEENELKRKSTQKKTPVKTHKIIINNMEFDANNPKITNNNSPQLIKHDYNIFINNITFKEIEASKKKEANYQENFAKISEKLNLVDLETHNSPKIEQIISSDQISEEIMISSKGETAKKYAVKASPILLESEKKCEIIASNPNYNENLAIVSTMEKTSELPLTINEDIDNNNINNQINEKNLNFPGEKEAGKQIKQSSSVAKLEEIVSESEDSESGRSSSRSSKDLEEKADKMDKIIEEKVEIAGEAKEEKESMTPKDPSRSGSRSTNSDINRLSKISKTSLGNLCKITQQRNYNVSPFNHLYKKTKNESENEMKNGFSKPQMILLNNGLISNKHNMTPFLFYLGKAMVYIFGELDSTNPGLSKMAFTHETAQIRDFITSFPTRFGNFDYSLFDKKILVPKENLAKAQKQLNFLTKEIRETRNKLPPYLKDMKSTLQKIINSQNNLRKKQALNHQKTDEDSPQTVNFQGFYSEIAHPLNVPDKKQELHKEKAVKTMRNFHFKSRSKEKKKEQQPMVRNSIKPLIDLYENGSKRKKEIELLKNPRKLRFQKNNSPENNCPFQKKKHFFLSPQKSDFLNNNTDNEVPQRRSKLWNDVPEIKEEVEYEKIYNKVDTGTINQSKNVMNSDNEIRILRKNESMAGNNVLPTNFNTKQLEKKKGKLSKTMTMNQEDSDSDLEPGYIVKQNLSEQAINEENHCEEKDRKSKKKNNENLRKINEEIFNLEQSSEEFLKAHFLKNFEKCQELFADGKPSPLGKKEFSLQKLEEEKNMETFQTSKKPVTLPKNDKQFEGVLKLNKKNKTSSRNHFHKYEDFKKAELMTSSKGERFTKIRNKSTNERSEQEDQNLFNEIKFEMTNNKRKKSMDFLVNAKEEADCLILNDDSSFYSDRNNEIFKKIVEKEGVILLRNDSNIHVDIENIDKNEILEKNLTEPKEINDFFENCNLELNKFKINEINESDQNGQKINQIVVKTEPQENSEECVFEDLRSKFNEKILQTNNIQVMNIEKIDENSKKDAKILEVNIKKQEKNMIDSKDNFDILEEKIMNNEKILNQKNESDNLGEVPNENHKKSNDFGVILKKENQTEFAFENANILPKSQKNMKNKLQGEVKQNNNSKKDETPKYLMKNNKARLNQLENHKNEEISKIQKTQILKKENSKTISKINGFLNEQAIIPKNSKKSNVIQKNEPKNNRKNSKESSFQLVLNDSLENNKIVCLENNEEIVLAAESVKNNEILSNEILFNAEKNKNDLDSKLKKNDLTIFFGEKKEFPEKKIIDAQRSKFPAGITQITTKLEQKESNEKVPDSDTKIAPSPKNKSKNIDCEFKRVEIKKSEGENRKIDEMEIKKLTNSQKIVKQPSLISKEIKPVLSPRGTVKNGIKLHGEKFQKIEKISSISKDLKSQMENVKSPKNLENDKKQEDPQTSSDAKISQNNEQLKSTKDDSKAKDESSINIKILNPIDPKNKLKIKFSHQKASPKNFLKKDAINQTFLQKKEEIVNNKKEFLSRSFSVNQIDRETNKKGDNLLRLIANSIDEKKLWREGYFRKDFNGDPFRVYNMLKSQNVKICKKLRLMRSCEKSENIQKKKEKKDKKSALIKLIIQYFEEFLSEKLEEEKKEREKLNKEKFDDYVRMKKSNLNFELKAQHWMKCFQEMFDELMSHV